ncbi:MAG: SDR family NAD(P)-dependent oxidoreductase, partial [Caulobacter sp.]
MTSRTYAITGGFGVLGQAVARAVLASGGQAALIDFAPEGRGLPDGAIAIGGVDLSDEGQAKAAMDRAAEALGGLDVLVNVAGGFTWQTLADGDLAAWSRMFALNTLTCASACKAALPHLLAARAGRIVSVGAGGAGKAAAGMGAYAASKAGV